MGEFGFVLILKELANAKTFGRDHFPYDQIRILHVTDGAAQRVLVADESDFSGLEVEWDRDSPITFPGVDLTKLCPFTWSADQDVLASGFGPTRARPARRVSLDGKHIPIV